MAVNTINFRLMDAEQDSRLATHPVYVPTGLTLAQYQTFADAYAPLLDAVTGSEITDIELNIALSLVAGLKGAPAAASLNERGGIIGFDTSGQFNDSVRIPAILLTIMPGDSFSVFDTDIDALVTMLQSGNGTVDPKTRDGFDWVSALYGKKSFRRK